MYVSGSYCVINLKPELNSIIKPQPKKKNTFEKYFFCCFDVFTLIIYLPKVNDKHDRDGKKLSNFTALHIVFSFSL